MNSTKAAEVKTQALSAASNFGAAAGDEAPAGSPGTWAMPGEVPADHTAADSKPRTRNQRKFLWRVMGATTFPEREPIKVGAGG